MGHSVASIEGVESGTPVYGAEELTAGGNQAQIRLSEAVYTLRITRQGKLILTK
ncbi:hemin uptake protein HemP [uncultured Shimia sp.]|uniref:hemin uptake protein HemP n=1 Tax=uncultured Shimia sp. TaxID=573152 RepID=UPI0026302E4E|nr:hemin uptake protein HemP [uncultured Shimia sp.]